MDSDKQIRYMRCFQLENVLPSESLETLKEKSMNTVRVMEDETHGTKEKNTHFLDADETLRPSLQRTDTKPIVDENF
jgi:hypothetical protein